MALRATQGDEHFAEPLAYARGSVWACPLLPSRDQRERLFFKRVAQRP